MADRSAERPRRGPATTSPRHTEILDCYRKGLGPYNDWAVEKFGRLSLVSWEWGRIALDWEIDERLLMPDGVMFGGHVAAAADHVAALATMTALETNEDRFRTSRLDTNFFRPMMRPRASIAGRVVNVSKSLIHVEADFLNAEGKLAVRVAAVQVRRKA